MSHPQNGFGIQYVWDVTEFGVPNNPKTHKNVPNVIYNRRLSCIGRNLCSDGKVLTTCLTVCLWNRASPNVLKRHVRLMLDGVNEGKGYLEMCSFRTSPTFQISYVRRATLANPAKSAKRQCRGHVVLKCSPKHQYKVSWERILG